jgi:hypothetical protein
LRTSNLFKVVSWTIKSDIVFPFLEIVLAVSLYIILTKNPLSSSASSDLFTNLTWDLIYLIVIFVGIAGARGYAIALERGEIGRQMIGLRISRTKIILLKWLSIQLVSFVLILAVDIVAFFWVEGYFPSPAAYSIWGSAPLVAFLVMVLEQFLLIAFLNSLSAAVSLVLKRTIVSLLIFFIVTLLGVQLYVVGSTVTGGPFSYLQLGWGDYNIVMDITNYLYYGFLNYNPLSASFLHLSLQFYVGLIYRVLGAIALLWISILAFRRADLD